MLRGCLASNVCSQYNPGVRRALGAQSEEGVGSDLRPGNEIEDRYPEKVAAVRRFLSAALGVRDIPKSEEFDRKTVLFRTPSMGLVAFSHEFFSDSSDQEIRAQLHVFEVRTKARQIAAGERLTVTTEGVFSS